MAHLRKRHLQHNLEHLVRFSPLVGVLGHRQVGKTTLLTSYSSDYRSFDQKSERDAASNDIEKYVQSLKGVKTVIDESQLVPDLFFELKERVRKRKQPGQFILSGSVRFTSRKAIQESLTGRIQNLELLPFSISEIDERELSTALQDVLSATQFNRLMDRFNFDSKIARVRNKSIHAYLVNGGLPGVCFIRNPVIQKNKILDQLRTILDRDVRTVYPTTLTYDQIAAYLTELALLQGQVIRFEDLRRKTGITTATQQKLLYAFEAVFLIRRIPIEGGMKGFIVLLEDQGESNCLAGQQLQLIDQKTHLFYRNIRTEFFYRLEKNVIFFQYRTRSKVEVPICIRFEQQVLGFLLIESKMPNHRELAAAHSFLSAYQNSKFIFVSEDPVGKVLNDRTVVLPLVGFV
jgi:predicted AAA+ superfamily ATPase